MSSCMSKRWMSSNRVWANNSAAFHKIHRLKASIEESSVYPVSFDFIHETRIHKLSATWRFHVDGGRRRGGYQYKKYLPVHGSCDIRLNRGHACIACLYSGSCGSCSLVVYA